MRRTILKFVSFCLMSAFVCGCVTRTSFRRNASQGKDAYQPVKSSSLSQYMRAVYQLSSEAGNKQTEKRAALLSQDPELQELVTRTEQDPADSEARSKLVTAYMDHQLYWAAYELLTSAEAANPNAPDIQLNLARIWDQWGQYDLALKYAARAVDTGAVTASAYEVLGRIHLHRKSPAEAVTWFQRAAAQNDNAAVLANLGYTHILLAEWEQAKVALEKAIVLDSDIAEAHNNLAIVLSKLGDEQGALAHLSKTAKPSIAFNNMGVLYLQEGQFERAQNFFEASLRLDPAYETAQRNLRTAKDVTAPPSIVHLPSFTSPTAKATASQAIECDVAFEAKEVGSVPAESIPARLEEDVQEAVAPVDTTPALTDGDALPPVTKLESPVQEPEETATPKENQDDKPPAQKEILADLGVAVPESQGAVCASKASHAKPANSGSMLSLNRGYVHVAGIAGFLLVASSIAWRKRRMSN